MLPELNLAIQTLLHLRGRVAPGEIDVAFETPERQWVDSLVRPTLNLFLYEVEENTDLRQTAMQTGRGPASKEKEKIAGFHRMPPRRFDLRYLVSTPSSVVEHEHLLLWRTLAVLLKFPAFPPEVLAATAAVALREIGALAHDDGLPLPDPPADDEDPAPFIEALRDYLHELKGAGRVRDGLLALTGEPPVGLAIGRPKEGPRLHDLWGALDLTPRPALILTATVPLDLEIALESPLVVGRRMRYTAPSGTEELHPEQISGRDKANDYAPQDGVAVLETRPSSRGIIRGIVRSRTLRRPLAGVTLKVEGASGPPARTDAEGRFTLTNIAEGELRLRVLRTGQSPALVSLTVPAEQYIVELE